MRRRRRSSSAHSPRDAHPLHAAVLREDVVSALARPSALLIDGTVGDGGHAAALLEASGATAQLLGFDLDRRSLQRAGDRLAGFGPRARLVHDTFANIAPTARREGFVPATGILFDLGMSSLHLGVERGFSFHSTGSLDMRFDADGAVALPRPEQRALRALADRAPSYTAADVVATLRADELADVFRLYGDERHAERIADAIVRTRRAHPLRTAPELVETVVTALPQRARHGRIHAATRVFQALRIAVNRELESLQHGIAGALVSLALGGRLAVIAFHSGEDRMVKTMFRKAAAGGAYRILTKHTIRPTEEERLGNPRSRSARLRIIERIDERSANEGASANTRTQ